MKNYIIPVLLLLAASSCSVLKSRSFSASDSSFSRQTALSKSQTLNSSGSTQRLLFLTDSSDHRYQAEIIPSGPFHYSPSEGFTGSASRVLISGRLRSAASRRDSSGGSFTLAAQSKADSSSQVQKSSSVKEKAKEVKRPVSWWVWVVGAVAAAGGVGFVKRKKTSSAIIPYPPL